MLLRNGKEYVVVFGASGSLKIAYSYTTFPEHLKKYRPHLHCSKCVKSPWLTCGMCGIECCSNHIDYFSADCECCHDDFCEDCCEIINQRDSNKCDRCLDCSKKCHYGPQNGSYECGCSDVEDEDEEDC